jgi:hypothetical protein
MWSLDRKYAPQPAVAMPFLLAQEQQVSNFAFDCLGYLASQRSQLSSGQALSFVLSQ